MVPTLLDRIQLWRVRRQRFESEPVGVVLLEICRSCTMCGQAVPDHDNMASIMTMQKTKQPDQLLLVDVLLRDMKIERQVVTNRRNADDADHGKAIVAIPKCDAERAAT